MKTFLVALVILLASTGSGKAQIYLEPVIGFQVDQNNHGKFKQINTGAQVAVHTRAYEFAFQVMRSSPLRYSSYDSSFSTNPLLPLYASTKKTFKPASWSFNTLHCFRVFSSNSVNNFYLVISAGFVSQKMNVSYQYDKKNYIILNPDKTLTQSGLYLGMGAEYIRQLKKGRVFFQLLSNTEPLAKKIHYPSSHRFIAALAFNAGYSIPIKSDHHGKK